MISLIGFNLLQQKQRLRAINCEIMTVLLLLRFLWIICALSLTLSHLHILLILSTTITALTNYDDVIMQLAILNK